MQVHHQAIDHPQDASRQSAIIWPLRYQPGTTDNFTSNEQIASGITASHVWSLLSNINAWHTYYPNVAQITPPSSGPNLQKGDTFHFSTFGFPELESHVKESVPPSAGQAGRLAWSAALEGSEEEAVDVYHAWLVEDLPNGRVRILTQESQIGRPAAKIARERPNVMLLGHQDWVEGLIRKARGEEVVKEETNLARTGLLAY